MLFIRVAHPSPTGGSLRSRRCLFLLGFAPCLMGGKTGRIVLSGGRDYAAFRDSPPSVPAGDTGEKGKKGIAGLGRSRRSLNSTAELCEAAGSISGRPQTTPSSDQSQIPFIGLPIQPQWRQPSSAAPHTL
jgi:hypothetical protein